MILPQSFIDEFFTLLGKDESLDKEDIAKLKITLCKKHKVKKIPTDIEILLLANPEQVKRFRKRLQTKPNRSLSGVAPLAIMTSPARCPHGKCRMCPGGLNGAWGDTPQSYTGAEPATMRGIRSHYDPYLQIYNRLEQYMVTGHIADKVDLIIMGGTFPARDEVYQNEFVMYSFKAMNDFSEQFFINGEFNIEKFKKFFLLPGDVGSEERTKLIQKKLLEQKSTSTIEREHERNQTSAIRCIGLTIETKPDWAFLEHGNRMLAQGCTRIELGIQSVYDEPLKAIHRGHTVADNKKSVQILKDLGFKLNYHMMIGLPSGNNASQLGDGVFTGRISLQEDIQGLKMLFDDEDYRPDMIKIYPCMVMPQTPLEIDFKKGLFSPILTEEAAKIITGAIKFVQPYCRIMRVQRDIPTYRITSGVDKTNLRQYVDLMMKKEGVASRDIRAREIGRKKIIREQDIKLQVIEYVASGGKEFFISYEDVANDIILGFCRLRFPGQFLREEITPTTAIIRELHVYGSAVGIGGVDKDSSQHHGYGTRLLKRAEEIARNAGKNKMIVISGVGVRAYYKKFGYKLEGPYVSKSL